MRLGKLLLVEDDRAVLETVSYKPGREQHEVVDLGARGAARLAHIPPAQFELLSRQMILGGHFGFKSFPGSTGLGRHERQHLDLESPATSPEHGQLAISRGTVGRIMKSSGVGKLREAVYGSDMPYPETLRPPAQTHGMMPQS